MWARGPLALAALGVALFGASAIVVHRDPGSRLWFEVGFVLLLCGGAAFAWGLAWLAGELAGAVVDARADRRRKHRTSQPRPGRTRPGQPNRTSVPDSDRAPS